MFSRSLIAPLLGMTLWLAACEWQPDAAPRFLPGGKEAALLLPTEVDGKQQFRELAITDIPAGTVDSFPAPQGLRFLGFIPAGKRLLVQFDGDPFPDDGVARSYYWLDRKRRTYTAADNDAVLDLLEGLDRQTAIPDMEAMTAKAVPALLARGVSFGAVGAAGEDCVAVLRFPALDRVAQRETSQKLLAGWEVGLPDGTGVEMDIYDEKAKLLGTIKGLTAGKELDFVPAVQLSPDRAKALVLKHAGSDAPDGLDWLFSIEDLRGSKTLWSVPVKFEFGGIPAFDGQAITVVEKRLVEGLKSLSIVRYWDGGRVDLLRLPAEGVPKFLFAASANSDRLAIQTMDEGAVTLYVVMLGAELNAEAVKTIRIREATGSGS